MADKPSFEIGDIVQLASGGPKMTVDGKGTSEGCLHCTWFDKEGKEQGSQFPPGALVKAKAQSES